MRRGVALAGVMVAAVLAAGCGGGGSSPSGEVNAARVDGAAPSSAAGAGSKPPRELPAQTCPDDLTLDGGKVRYKGAMVPVSKETWDWVQANCSGTRGPSGGASSGGTENPPVFERLPVDASAFDLSYRGDARLMDQGPIVPSGAVVEGHGAEPSIVFQLLRRDADVRAVAAGVVVDVKEQRETCDVEIMVIGVGADGRSATWVVGYDHIESPKVKRGDTIAAGDVLGRPGQGIGASGECNPTAPGRVELQVNHKEPTREIAVCPINLFGASARSTATGTIADLMQRWNAAIGRTVYAPDVIARGGCVADETVP